MQHFPDNTEIIKKLKAGHQNTYKELYISYFSKLIGIAKKFNFTVLSPEDFVHETFLKLYKKRALLKEEVLIDKQLFVICKHIILNHIKKEKKNIAVEEIDVLLPDSEKEETHETTEDAKKIIHQLIHQLPYQQKKIFKLHKINGYSYAEIEEITKLSPKTIANHIYLANKFLKENSRKPVS